MIVFKDWWLITPSKNTILLHWKSKHSLRYVFAIQMPSYCSVISQLAMFYDTWGYIFHHHVWWLNHNVWWLNAHFQPLLTIIFRCMSLFQQWPSGNLSVRYGKSTCFKTVNHHQSSICKGLISYVKLPKGNCE